MHFFNLKFTIIGLGRYTLDWRADRGSHYDSEKLPRFRDNVTLFNLKNYDLVTVFLENHLTE